MICDTLVTHFGKENIFFDVDVIPLGMDFHRILNEAVAKCDVLLAVIGDHWLDAKDEAGQRRLDNCDDFVRIEIESALSRSIPVIPVLVGRASVPQPSDLPPALRELAKRQATEVRFGRDRDTHLERLARDIERAVMETRKVAPPTITELLQHNDLHVRLGIAKVLERIGPQSQSVISDLTKVLSDKDRELRITAAKALSKAGPAAIPVLTGMLGDKNVAVQYAAVRAIGAIGAKAIAAIPALRKLAEGDGIQGRQVVAKALGEIGPAAVKVLTELLTDDNCAVRRSAAKAFWNMGREALTAAPALTRLLDDEDPHVRRAAVTALGNMGPDAIVAVPALIGLLNDKEVRVRQSAAEALRKIQIKC